QWTPIKASCLAVVTSTHEFRADALGAMRTGAKSGLYCLGCCWALVALLFIGGVMNLMWIAGLAILVLLEKTMPVTRLWIPRVSGVLLFIAGVWLLLWTPLPV